MSARKPAFLFVPGGFCPGFYFHKVISKLHSLGYEAQAVDLPSIGRPSDPTAPAPSCYDDAAHVRSAGESLLDAGHDLIIVGNSYGGFVSNEASKGLAAPDRAAAGKTGGALQHVIIMGCLVPDLGKTVKELVGDHIPLDLSEVDPNNPWLEPVPAAIAGHLFFGELPEEEQLYYGAMGKPMSVNTFLDPLTYAAYEHVPMTVVISELDKAVDLKVQERSFDEKVQKGVKGLRKVMIKSDHCAMVTSPDEVVRVCLEAGGQSTST